jgi:hypothetical protein
MLPCRLLAGITATAGLGLRDPSYHTLVRDENRELRRYSIQSIEVALASDPSEQVLRPSPSLTSPLGCANMSGNSTITLPNPFTPLAFLPQTLANQYEASRYLYVATLGVSKLLRCSPRR